jgi:hypothetical protein
MTRQQTAVSIFYGQPATIQADEGVIPTFGRGYNSCLITPRSCIAGTCDLRERGPRGAIILLYRPRKPCRRLQVVRMIGAKVNHDSSRAGPVGAHNGNLLL